MPQVIEVRIQSLKDVEKHQPIFEDIKSFNDFAKGEVVGFGILQGGMEGGGTSVMFKISVEGLDKPVIAEMSANMFRTLNGTLHGAEQRFDDENDEGLI